MNRSLLALAATLAISGIAHAQDNSARAGFVQDTRTPAAINGGAEDFADITNLPGWIMDNQSNPLGTTDWFQGNDTVFAAQAGATTAYIAANFNNTSGSNICNWLIMPDNGFVQSVTFWTRTTTGNTFPDRMHVVHSPSGGTTTGDCFGGFGDFTNTLLTINDGLVTGGYPQDWTEFTVNPNASGRVAFVYYVANGGPTGVNSNYIGLDTVSFVAGIPESDLSVSVSNNATQPVQIGQQFQFTVTASNAGPGDATGVVVNNTLSQNLSYVSDTCGSTVAGNSVMWNLGALANGGSAACDITVQVDGAGALSNTASISGNETDPVPGNNAAGGTIAGVAQTIPTLGVVGGILLALCLLIVARRRMTA